MPRFRYQQPSKIFIYSLALNLQTVKMRRNEKNIVDQIKIVLIHWLWKKSKRPTILKVRQKTLKIAELEIAKEDIQAACKVLLNV